MRDFVFTLKDDPTKKATLRVDIMDDEFERFTIMWIEGVRETIFENYIPWKLGSVISEQEIQDWFSEFQPALSGYKYGEDTGVKVLGVEEYELTITPAITNGDTTSVIVFCKNSDGVVFEKTVVLTDGQTSKVLIIEGYEYDFKCIEGNTWTSVPTKFTCDGDEAITLNISVPIVLPEHIMTITPTLTGGTETTATLRGTKTDFTTLDTPLTLADEPLSVDIYEGYSYSFILDDNDTWTSGSAPTAIVCDGDERVSLGITVVTV